MIHSVRSPPSSPPGNFTRALHELDGYPEHALALIEHALGALRAPDGEPDARVDLEHVLATARRLNALGLDPETLAASVLCAGVRSGVIAPAELEPRFPREVAELARGVLRMRAIDELGQRERPAGPVHTERLKNLLLAMVQDVRIVIIGLADRLERLRRPGAVPAEPLARLARATLDVYAPLASRLGIWQFKWELEDLAFRVLEPETYRSIARQLEARRSEREQYVTRVITELEGCLADAGLPATITGRVKHIYGIVRKMRRKDVGFERVFDALALRVILADVTACYAALGLVHARWAPVPGEFDDYIARPKRNGYQSLHTAVFGPGGRTIEVQIRTREMHRRAEFGVAAHWRYKEGERTAGQSVEARAAWLRQVLDWSEEVVDRHGQATDEALASEVDRVYVLTPRGDILDLPAGSTPLDFAYHVHTDVGHRCRGAKVNGAMVPLTQPLRSGDCVEILTTRNGTPSRDWLNPNLGYLRTPRARAKVRQWLRQLDYDQNRADGAHAFNRELSRLGVEGIDREALAARFNFARFDDLMAGLGGGDVSLGQIAGAIQQLLPRPPAPEPEPARRARPGARSADRGVEIQGVGSLLTTIARCCHPVPPEQIVGYVTRGRGVSIHRRDCGNILRLDDENRTRLIDVSWRPALDETYPVTVQITAFNRPGLLRDVTTVVSGEDVNVAALNSGPVRPDETVAIQMTVEVRSLAELGRVIDRVSQVTNVIEARSRKGDAEKGARRRRPHTPRPAHPS